MTSISKNKTKIQNKLCILTLNADS